MAVFRIEKTRDYTVMSNHHLRNAGLSLKSKGLLSMMLSLPEDWNYTTRGLVKISARKGMDSDEYQDYDLVVALPNGRPCEDRVLLKEFSKLREKEELPKVVFHSLRHPYVKHTTKNIILKSRKPKLSENRPDNLGFLLL